MFAIFNLVGTEQNLAVRPFLNALKVPQLFGGTGVRAIGREHKKYQWSMGYLPSFFAEGACTAGTSPRRGRTRRSRCSTRRATTAATCSPGSRRASGRRRRSSAQTTYEVTDTDLSSQIAQLKPLGRERADAVRAAEADDRGLRRREPVRLEAADVRDVGVRRPGGDEDRPGDDREQGRRGRDHRAVDEGHARTRRTRKTLRSSSTRRSCGATRPAGTSTRSSTSTAWPSPTRWCRPLKAAGRNPTRDEPPPRGDAPRPPGPVHGQGNRDQDLTERLLPDLRRAVPALQAAATGGSSAR